VALVVPHRAGAQQSLTGRGIEGQGSRVSILGAAQEVWGPGGVWIQCGAVAWCRLRGGEPSGAEQQLCRPTGWGLGRLAVLLLDCGMEKPSMM
jgi:hypothetical protein